MPIEENVRTVREAVGVFSSLATLQDAIDELLGSGTLLFRRALYPPFIRYSGYFMATGPDTRAYLLTEIIDLLKNQPLKRSRLGVAAKCLQHAALSTD